MPSVESVLSRLNHCNGTPAHAAMAAANRHINMNAHVTRRLQHCQTGDAWQNDSQSPAFRTGGMFSPHTARAVHCMVLKQKLCQALWHMCWNQACPHSQEPAATATTVRTTMACSSLDLPVGSKPTGDPIAPCKPAQASSRQPAEAISSQHEELEGCHINTNIIIGSAVSP